MIKDMQRELNFQVVEKLSIYAHGALKMDLADYYIQTIDIMRLISSGVILK